MQNVSPPGLLSRLTIAHKVIALFLLNVLIALVISAVCLLSLTSISNELHQVAHEDIPLTAHITSISSQQLEQAIHLERAFRYGELMVLGRDTGNGLEKEVAYFRDIGARVDNEIVTTENLLEEFLAIDHTEKVEQQFRKVLNTLKEIEAKHKTFSELAEQSFTLLRGNDLDAAERVIKKLTVLEDELDSDVINVLKDFEAFTEQSLLLAEEHELAARSNIFILSLFFLALSSALSFFIIRSVSGPLSRMKEALITLGNGRSVDFPPIKRGTELGDVFHSISIIGNNFNAINRSQASLFVALDGKVEFANDNFLACTGYSLHEIVGKPFRNLCPTSSHPWIQQWDSLVAGHEIHGEYEVARSDGAACWLQATCNPILGLEGETTRIIVFATDISEEVASRKEVEMLSLVAEKTDNLVVITDAQQRIEYVNDGFTRLTGYTFEECVGRKPSFLQGEDTDPQTLNHVRQQIQSQEPFYDEILNYTKDRKPYWVSMAINPVFDKSGKLVRFVSIQGDVTENKTRALENENGMRESVAVLQALARGDLSTSMQGHYEGTFKEIGTAINDTMQNLVEVVEGIRDVANHVDTAAKEINEGNRDLSNRTERAAAALQETSSSMYEITATVSQNVDNSSRANQMVSQAQNEAEKGGEIVGQAVSAMVEINDSSKKISDIVGVIDDIAFQTNLLALNASVEAARAGEQGRGFAVVASEVRNLAGRSAVAAKEIKELIDDSVQRVANGVELVNASGERLQDIVTQVKGVAEIVSEIYVASQEQSEGIQQIDSSIRQLDNSTQQNASLVEEATAASRSTMDQAESLIKMIGFFNAPSGAGNRTGKASAANQKASSNDANFTENRPAAG
jgi:methyl-accepting chemotaxis protein